jgi:metallo-beta-lactamase class B
MRLLSAFGGFFMLLWLPVSAGHAAATDCSTCAAWNQPQAPFKIYGNTYYVGMHGLSSILIVTDKGDILIDGALEESAKPIADHIRALGFHLSDVKWILNSHVHFDHAGGIAELQRLTGAKVMASPWTAAVMRRGIVARDDPQYGAIRPIGRVARVQEIADGGTVGPAALALTAHFTPGHTLGGTSWTWTSCDAGRCLHMVYIDSLTAVSADGFRFTDTARHPGALASFDRSFAKLSALPCEILLTPHPDASDLLGKQERRAAGQKPDPFIAPDACGKFLDTARVNLAKRVAAETSAGGK